jgi:hypothetical protein
MLRTPLQVLARLLLEGRTAWVERMVAADERLAERQAPASVRLY